MARKVADIMWDMLANAGVTRCYGIVGDALNPVIDALRRAGLASGLLGMTFLEVSRI
jgi:pyruvate dehydrogenase (quinone)